MCRSRHVTAPFLSSAGTIQAPKHPDIVGRVHQRGIAPPYGGNLSVIVTPSTSGQSGGTPCVSSAVVGRQDGSGDRPLLVAVRSCVVVRPSELWATFSLARCCSRLTFDEALGQPTDVRCSTG